MSKIKEALAVASETKDLRIGFGVLSEVADIFKLHFPQQSAVVIADTTTFEVAGQMVVEKLSSSSIAQLSPFVFTDPALYAAYSYVEQLVAFLSDTAVIPIAVGSGTINDLTKLAAHLTNRPYLCVATAASMDGYTAYGASITINGAKQTFSCPAPRVCLADIAIISKAPALMTASGYADLFAKVTSGADWILADSLHVDPINETAWSIVQDGLHEALDDPEGIRAGNPEAITKLTAGLMLSGFAMQYANSSRPASGAEHQFSHLWNMEHHLNNGENVSHGFQVSIGTIAIIALYECFFATKVEELDIEKCREEWPTLAELEQQALDLFAATDFPEIGREETRAKYDDKLTVATQLHLLKTNWPVLKQKLQQQIVPYYQAIERLALVGAPTQPEHIGLSRERLYETFIRAQFIRRRFTILDISVRTGYLNQWLHQLFGKGGIWEL